MRALYVFKRDRLVGQLHADDERPSRYTFVYEKGATQNDFVSLTMPPSARTVWGPRPTLHPIFDMNLPEGERRVYLERATRVGGADDFTLLEAIGQRQIGLLRFAGSLDSAAPRLTPIRREQLERIDNGLKFFESIFEALSSSGISGVQPKALAATSGLPGTLISDTHILKRDRDPYPGMVVNEFLCTELMKKAGLSVPSCTLSEDGRLLVIERFDREGGHLWHFEEFCALMGLNSGDKYSSTYERLATSVNQFVQADRRQESVTALFRALVCYRLIGNADAHMKNFGVLCSGFEDVRMAPFYDVVSTLAFENVPPGVLMGGKGAWWERATLDRFGRYCGLTARDVDAHIQELCVTVEKAVPSIQTARKRFAHFQSVGELMVKIWKQGVQDIRAAKPARRPSLQYAKKKRLKKRIIGATSKF